MRRYIYIFGLTVLFWGTSCADFINIQPENATTYSNYYKNEKELEAVLTGLQVYLRQAVGVYRWRYFQSRRDIGLRQIFAQGVDIVECRNVEILLLHDLSGEFDSGEYTPFQRRPGEVETLYSAGIFCQGSGLFLFGDELWTGADYWLNN